MMKTLLVTLLLSVVSHTAFAQKGDMPDVPIVPIEVVAKGRQAIVDNVFAQADVVYSYLDGQSVVGQYSERHRWLEIERLRQLGYEHRGVFSEFSDAVSKVQYTANVIALSSGQYDVNVQLSLKIRTADGREKTALRGSGYLDVYEGDDGELNTSGFFEPWVYFDGQYAIRYTEDVTAARWLKANGGSEDLSVYHDADGNSYVILDDRMMDNGTLVAAINGKGGEHTISTDLSTGANLKGKDVFARMGQVSTPEYHILKNVSSIEQIDGIEFYLSSAWWDNNIYGRMPTIELVLDQAFRGKINFSIPVWGSQRRVFPSEIIVIPMTRAGDLTIGQEYTVDPNRISHLPRGKYHIRSSFKGVKDRSQDEYSYGKG